MGYVTENMNKRLVTNNTNFKFEKCCALRTVLYSLPYAGLSSPLAAPSLSHLRSVYALLTVQSCPPPPKKKKEKKKERGPEDMSLICYNY